MQVQCLIGMTCPWNHHMLILGKVYQLDSGVQLLDIPGGRVMRAMDFGYEVPRFESRP